MSTRTSYSEEFKREAVRLANESDNKSRVARDLGIHMSMLRRRTKQLEENTKITWATVLIDAETHEVIERVTHDREKDARAQPPSALLQLVRRVHVVAAVHAVTAARMSFTSKFHVSASLASTVQPFRISVICI